VLKMTPRSVVDEVDFVTSFGFGAGPDGRERLGLRGGGPSLVITDLGLLRPHPERRELVLTDLHPGVTVAMVKAAAGYDIAVADRVATTTVPTVAELEALHQLSSGDGKELSGA
jgi:glutaconate CoA-transferase subunit B